MTRKLVLKNEVVKVKGRVKIITVKKEDFEKFLKLTKLRVLNKEYEALMPPIDSLEKNTIDINGLAQIIQQYMSIMFFDTGNTNQPSPAQMVLATQSGNIVFPYVKNVNVNTQGVAIYMQVFEDNNNWTFQYYYIGFDTTNASYSSSEVDLYASAYLIGTNSSGTVTYYTELIRIAYTNIPFTKSTDSYLFIVWLIEFQNIPSVLIFFTPIFQNRIGITPYNGYVSLSNSTFAWVYFNNNSCNFACGGNCPGTGIFNFMINVKGNNIVIEVPAIVSLGTGVSNVGVLFCTGVAFQNLPYISGYTSATLTPPVTGATFYVAIATLIVTYQVS